ncbi:hypothetical protein BGZ61DRAFT_217432 [Ilyonectria robusta]|uniref:uncharacterized protein n=1 Tax=Ilyonectria robusta TaxID=1079257 RepID=UPI001E8DA734|nr:uncharacterized protein BGZ61DRAFT_217432 [Ilyonectria robusta]KAH8652579.1 hypothetical protein BGZ61DRAFT_217432 [Ilyonectria robusta]
MEPKIIASAKIKVHRYCAFMNSCGFLKAFEHLPEEQADSPTTSHLLAQLAKPVLTRVPYFFCSTVQCAYTIMMVYSGQDQPAEGLSAGSENDLRERCLRGLNEALVLLQRFCAPYGSVTKVYELVRDVSDSLIRRR